jgi:ABC-type Fe3+ transport system permease subunit
MQVHGELEEASQMAGAPWTRTIRRITVPLLAPALINVFFWVAVHAMQELSMALMLYNPDTVVVSTMIWSMWQNGQNRGCGGARRHAHPAIGGVAAGWLPGFALAAAGGYIT